jgi:dolichol-phosphate mannosyltransferase
MFAETPYGKPAIEAALAPRVIVLLPALNEEIALTRLLPRLMELREALPGSLRCLVVDDGSTDRTQDIARQYSDRGVYCFRHARNLGYGAALNSGLQHCLSDCDVIVTMDADDTHDPFDILLFLDKLARGSDVVVASRFASGSIQKGVPAKRRAVSRVTSRLVAFLLQEHRVSDFTSGFRAIRVEFVRRIHDRAGVLPMLTEAGFAGSFELLLALRREGARLSEVPFTLHYDRKPPPSTMVVGRTVRECAGVYFRMRSD